MYRQPGISISILTFLAASFLTACSSRMTRVAVSLPVEGLRQPMETVLTVGLWPQPYSGASVSLVSRLETHLKTTLVRGGRFRIENRLGHPPVTIPEALHRARFVGGNLLLIVRLNHFDIRTSVHHVRRYYDGSASGEALLYSAISGELLRGADERVALSTRRRYASRRYVEDLLLARLGDRLSRAILYEETPYFVNLEDAKGALRDGVVQAGHGDWMPAIRTWESGLKSQAGSPELHYNLGVAYGILGDPQAATRHLERALERDAGNTVYASTLNQLRQRGFPWEVL